MGEALIVSRGSGSGDSSILNGRLQTQIFTQDGLFIVPECKDQMVSVRIFGGGGGGLSYYDTMSSGQHYASAGGGGWMNNNVFKIKAGEQIPITIGKGGNAGFLQYNRRVSSTYITNARVDGTNGGTTSFGTYLSALGGEGGYIANSQCCGGNGGAGGAGWVGGTGFQFGGGAGNLKGGNGGKWGGGGGYYHLEGASRGGCLYENSQNMYEVTGYSGLAGNAGENGTNTLNIAVVDDVNCLGLGLSIPINEKCKNYTGGGGYGGCGLNSGQYNRTSGGGGYGANGGVVNTGYSGGGGYGLGCGGEGFSQSTSDIGFGGGGSYGKGGDSSLPKYGGGGYGYPQYNNGYSYEGYTANTMNGADGICIIQYYV